jgi:hypothetical protein
MSISTAFLVSSRRLCATIEKYNGTQLHQRHDDKPSGRLHDLTFGVRVLAGMG